MKKRKQKRVRLPQKSIKQKVALALLCFGLLLCVSTIHANVSSIELMTQQAPLTATGVVTDNWGEPLPGATIIEQGNRLNGTATDATGRFTLRVHADAVLEVAFLGFTPQTVAASVDMHIVLQDETSALEELIVVGFGTQRRENLTGAVSRIDSRDIANRSVPSLTQALQGQVAGLNITTPSGMPGQAQSVNIRGFTGISGTGTIMNAGPLVVIDGVQGGNLSLINMDDVESISFLKDAASAAIFGSSAPYGVIIVTTRRGRVGRPVITYSNNLSVSQPINLPRWSNALDVAHAFNEASANANRPPVFAPDVVQRMRDYQAGLIPESLPHPSLDQWLTWDSGHANNDWFDIYFRNFSFNQQHNIGISGATEQTNYLVSLGYMQQSGLYKWADDGFRRYNARANISMDLTKWLSFNWRSSFSRSEADRPAIYPGFSGGANFSHDIFHQLGRTFPTVPLRYANGSFSNGSGLIPFTEGGRNQSTSDNVSLTGEFVITPLEGWNITANYTFAGTYIESSNHRRTIYSETPGGVSMPLGFSVPSFLERNMYRNQRFTTNVFSSYETSLGNGHNLRGLVGFTQELHDNFRLMGAANRLYSGDVPALDVSHGDRNTADWQSQLAVRGVFTRINYNFQERYLLEFNGRYDGSSRFMTAERFRFYPGVSGAWAIAREGFWESLLPYVNRFTVRGSWASLGDQAVVDGWYPFFPSLGRTAPSNSNWFFGGENREAAISTPGLVNPHLTWATVTTVGAGVDAAAFSNRLNVSLDWYRRISSDFVGPSAELPALLGIGAPQSNNAEIQTTGWEVSMNWRDRIGQLTYGARFVLSDHIGRVTRFDGNPNRLLGSFYEGMRLGEIWGFETVGLFQTQEEIDATNQSILAPRHRWFPGDVHYRTFSEDGVLTRGNNTADNPGDRRVIGNTTPRFQFGLTLNAEYNNFDISTFFQGVGRRDIMFADNVNFFWGVVNSEWQSSYFTVHQDRWTPENPNGFLPRMEFGTNKNRLAQTRYLQNAAYLRWRNAQVGYTLPRAVTNKINFERVRFFVNMENLATFTSLTRIMDPELVNAEAKVYPLSRTFAIGTNITF